MNPESQSSSWNVRQVVIMAALCFVLGSAIGYFAHAPAAKPAAAVNSAAAIPANPTPAQMKAASSKAAGSVLEQLKTDPKNVKLLVEAGEMYYHHGAFGDAATYYQRALAEKDDPAVRNQYASALFYQGDGDNALKQYDQVLAKDPKNEIALFNSGMIRLKSKNDAKGAVAQWQKLLQAYPNHPRKRQVEDLIAQARKTQG